jgi:dTDP-4-dehydrorhamnose reductase
MYALFIKPVSSDIFDLLAKRPKFSAMSNERLRILLNFDIKKWDIELFDVMKN